jgi:hypothetical protein
MNSSSKQLTGDTQMSKPTRATLKSFIKKNFDNMFVSEKSRFDGMVDCVMPSGDNSFTKALRPTYPHDNNMNVQGVWCVGGGRDYITPYEKDGFKGFDVSNCCGHFIVATKG